MSYIAGPEVVRYRPAMVCTCDLSVQFICKPCKHRILTQPDGVEHDWRYQRLLQPLAPLLPCRHCGGQAQYGHDGYPFLACTGCGYRVDILPDLHKLQREWNRRA